MPDCTMSCSLHCKRSLGEPLVGMVTPGSTIKYHRRSCTTACRTRVKFEVRPLFPPASRSSERCLQLRAVRLARGAVHTCLASQQRGIGSGRPGRRLVGLSDRPSGRFGSASRRILSRRLATSATTHKGEVLHQQPDADTADCSSFRTASLRLQGTTIRGGLRTTKELAMEGTMDDPLAFDGQAELESGTILVGEPPSQRSGSAELTR